MTTEKHPSLLSWLQPDSHNRFMVGNEQGLYLYRMNPTPPKRGGGQGAKFELENFYAMPNRLTSLTAYPQTPTDINTSVVSSGDCLGQVHLHMYGQTSTDFDNAYVGTSVTVYEATERECRKIQFNPARSDLLACGFEYREGYAGVSIHDIAMNSDVRQLLGEIDDGLVNDERLKESSGVTSLAWMPTSVNELIVASWKGAGSSIYQYDIREPWASPKELSSDADAVYDLQFDPFSPYRYISHNGNGIARVWDIRRAQQPLYEIPVGCAGAMGMLYSPRRKGTIATTSSNGSIEVLDLHEYMNGRVYDSNYESLEIASLDVPFELEHWVQRSEAVDGGISSEPMTGFAWIPTESSSTHQFVIYGENGNIRTGRMRVERAMAVSCKGDAAVATGWGNPEVATTRMAHLDSSLAVDKNAVVRELIATAKGNSTEASLAADIVSVMRERALQGYGPDATKNVQVVQKDARLRDLWHWLRDAGIRRRSGAYFVDSITDVSFFGVWDILQLRRKQVRYIHRQAKMEALGAEGGVVAVKTRIPTQRSLALSFCGWGLTGHIREQHIRALESAQQFGPAAGAAFIYGDHNRCLRALERSNAQDQKLLSFMLRAQLDDGAYLARGDGVASSAPTDMFTCPHLQMIFAFLVTGDWNLVVKDMRHLPLSSRVAVALRYFDDISLKRFLLDTGCTATSKGELDGLIVTGITADGRSLIQRYVDNTTDVQTAALIASLDPVDSPSEAAAAAAAEHWTYSYRHLLNMWRMFSVRCLFDIARATNRSTKQLPRFSEIGKKIAVQPADLRCTFCHQNIGYETSRSHTNIPSSTGVIGVKNPSVIAPAIPGVGTGIGAAVATAAANKASTGNASQARLIHTKCSRCGNLLPRCCLCRMTLGTPMTTSDTEPLPASGFAHWFSWCQTCGHGGHVEHLDSWFTNHDECPIPGCDCNCKHRY